MSTTPTEAEKVQLELINKQIKQADLEMKLYAWIVMPVVLALVGSMIYSMLQSLATNIQP
jgi:hypothetical protein